MFTVFELVIRYSALLSSIYIIMSLCLVVYLLSIFRVFWMRLQSVGAVRFEI